MQSAFELFIWVGASVVLALYVFNVFRPYLSRLFPQKDPAERAAELANEYHRKKREEEG